MDRFYGDDATRRFLVADETGLGKSMVAAGVVARTIEHLMHDDTVDRIDIVYVCSKADLARQNLKRIDVVHGSASRLQFTDRLSMLALDSHRLQAPMAGLPKPVNLIRSRRARASTLVDGLGRVDERALVALLMKEQLKLSAWDMRAAWQILRGAVDITRFPNEIARIEKKLADERDPDIVRQFKTLVRKHTSWTPSSADSSPTSAGSRRCPPTSRSDRG